MVTLPMLSSRSEVIVRSAKVADAARLSSVFRESWQNAYAGIIPHTSLENILQRRDAVWWRSQIRTGEPVLVLEVSGKVGGYATTGLARSRGAYHGEIYELYLVPSFQGLGLGEYLFEACRFRLDQRRLQGLIVWALSDNDRAIDFYTRRGGRPVARVNERFGATKLEKIALGWK
jgi:GNAT superfamily N-acetyltransferase